MIVSIAEDFTSKVNLDSQLLEYPDTGLYLNSGSHSSITLENLIAFLPAKDIVCEPYKSTTTYGVYETTRKRTDLVIYDDVIYQSISSANVGNTPSASPTQWLKTNKDSLSLKNLIYKTTDKVKADLGLTKRLINTQRVYENGDQSIVLPNDYSAWVFEFKGSDYVTITINKLFLQKNSSTPVNLYVINQGDLIDTLTITPADGDIEWNQIDYSFTGAGKWIFAIDSTDVLVGDGYIDPLKYDGFLAYTSTGVGNTPQDADYVETGTGNGIGWDISVFKDGGAWLTDNLDDLGNLFRATFEYIVFQMFLHNPNNQSNRAERIMMNEELLLAEVKSLEGDTVVSRYVKEVGDAKRVLAKSNDVQLSDDRGDFIIELGII